MAHMNISYLEFRMNERDAQRFWSHVDRSGNCWTWTASRNPDGYGRVYMHGKHGQLAHRIAWELTNGEIPDGLFVCHHCDNPSCVRPDHLFIGTCDDNHKDKARKGRSRNGWQTQPDVMRKQVTDRRIDRWGTPERTRRPYEKRSPKISREQVERVLSLRAQGLSYPQIAAQAAVSRMTAYNIVNGRGKYGRHVGV